jgi:hypothetical protein
MLPDTSRDMSTTRTPSSGHAALGSNDFSGTLIGQSWDRIPGDLLSFALTEGLDKLNRRIFNITVNYLIS